MFFGISLTSPHTQITQLIPPHDKDMKGASRPKHHHAAQAKVSSDNLFGLKIQLHGSSPKSTP